MVSGALRPPGACDCCHGALATATHTEAKVLTRPGGGGTVRCVRDFRRRLLAPRRPSGTGPLPLARCAGSAQSCHMPAPTAPPLSSSAAGLPPHGIWASGVYGIRHPGRSVFSSPAKARRGRPVTGAGSARGWAPFSTAAGITVGAGLGVVLGRMLSAGPVLSTWVIIGIGAGVAIGAVRDEAARLRVVSTGQPGSPGRPGTNGTGTTQPSDG